MPATGNLVKMSSAFLLSANSLSSTIPTELGKLDQMMTGFELSTNNFCSDVPTEVQALSDGVTGSWEVTFDTSIGTPCNGGKPPTTLPTAAVPVDHGEYGGSGGGNNVSTAIILACAGVALVLAMALASAMAERRRRRAAAATVAEQKGSVGDNTKYHLLEDATLSSWGDGAASSDATSVSQQWYSPQNRSRGLPRDALPQMGLDSQDEALWRSWSESNAQLFALDYDLRIILWSQGMLKTLCGFEPALGDSVATLPFASAELRSQSIDTMRRILGDGSTMRTPGNALQRAALVKPNMHLRLATSLGVGAQRDAVLSAVAVRMLSFSSAAADRRPCLLIMVRQWPQALPTDQWGGSEVLSDLTASEVESEGLATEMVVSTDLKRRAAATERSSSSKHGGSGGKRTRESNGGSARNGVSSGLSLSSGVDSNTDSTGSTDIAAPTHIKRAARVLAYYYSTSSPPPHDREMEADDEAAEQNSELTETANRADENNGDLEGDPTDEVPGYM